MCLFLQLNTMLSPCKYNFVSLEIVVRTITSLGMIKTADEKSREVWSLRFHQMGRGRYQLSLSKAVGSMCRRGVQEQKRRMTHGVEGGQTEHLDQERTKEIIWFLRSQWRQTCKQSTRWAVYSNNKKYCRVRGSCRDGHRRKQKYCSAKGKGFHKVTDIRKYMEDNHKGEEDEDQGQRRGLMSLGDLGQARRSTGACCTGDERKEIDKSEKGFLQAGEKYHWIGSEEICLDWGQKNLVRQNEKRGIGESSSRAFIHGKKTEEIPSLFFEVMLEYAVSG